MMTLQLPLGIRKQLRGLLGNTVGETDTIKVLAISGFVFAHWMLVRDFNVNHHFDFTTYCAGLGILLGAVAGAIRWRGDHDTPDAPPAAKPT